MMYVYISRGPKWPIVCDIVLTNLYITAAFWVYIQDFNDDKRKNCFDKNITGLQNLLHTRLFYFIPITFN